MGTAALIRRKHQLALLADACQRGHRARVALRCDDATVTGLTRLLALEGNTLLLYWPGVRLLDAATPGVPVEVFFEHAGQRYGFQAESRGRLRWSSRQRVDIPALRVSLPLRVAPQQQREHFRVSLAGLDPLEARLRGILADTFELRMRVTNVSCGGMGGVAEWNTVKTMRVGDILRATLRVPDDDQPLEFAVRLIHVHRVGQDDAAVTGWRFLPGDDGTANRANLRRLESFVARRPTDLPRRARRH